MCSKSTGCMRGVFACLCNRACGGLEQKCAGGDKRGSEERGKRN